MEKRKRGRPRTRPDPVIPVTWDMEVRSRRGQTTWHPNIPGSLSHDEALQRYGVPKHAWAWAHRVSETLLIQSPSA